MANQYKSINDTATTTENGFAVDVRKILLVANKATSTGDLLISFDKAMADGEEYLIIEPGEAFRNLEEMTAEYIYVKSSTGTASFRFFGIK